MATVREVIMQVGTVLSASSVPGDGNQHAALHLPGNSQDKAADNNGTGGVKAPLLKAIEETLSQLGLTSSHGLNSAGASAIASAGNRASTTTDALHAFAHALFQALHGTEAHEHPASIHPAYGAPYSTTLSNRLENLVQTLQASGGAATSPLSAAYQNLLKVLDNGVGSIGSAPPTLQTFIQDLLLNVQNGTATSVFSGASMISTTV
jgi:hypothetical protein